MRSELLSAEDARVRNGYVPWFLPIESENAEMDDEDEVRPPRFPRGALRTRPWPA